KRNLAAPNRLQFPPVKFLAQPQPKHGPSRLVDKNSELVVVAGDGADQRKLWLLRLLLRWHDHLRHRHCRWRRRRRPARWQENRTFARDRELLDRHRP